MLARLPWGWEQSLEQEERIETEQKPEESPRVQNSNLAFQVILKTFVMVGGWNTFLFRNVLA